MKKAIILSVFFLISTTGYSATIYVPDDYAKIQDAIANAANGDTVIVRPGTYIENIDFIGKAITLKGELGSAVTIIDGNQAGSVVTCQSGEDAYSVLDSFTITNGSGTDVGGEFRGGGMYNVSSSPTVINCSFVDTKVLDGGKGAGMCNISSSPKVTHCNFTNNSAPDGGDGGGMYNNSSEAMVSDCTFMENNADEGGGICNDASSPTITHCNFLKNTVHAHPDAFGGGMNNRNNSNSIVSDCNFEENSAFGGGDGGGMYNDSSSPTVADCSFTKNYADGPFSYGGGMCNRNSSYPMVTGCIFDANLTEGTDSSGGGMRNDESNPTVHDCIFIRNTAPREGGVSNNNSNLTITGCSFIGNVASKYTGGMSCGDFSTVSNCIFSENSAIATGGLGLGGNAIMINCSFTNNFVSNNAAGMGIGGDAVAINCVFMGNSSKGTGATTGHGGGMSLGGSPTLINCSIIGNSANRYGGGIYAFESDSPTLTNCSFYGNYAKGDGGGIYAYKGNLTLTNCILWKDTPDELFCDNTVPVVTHSCVKGGWPGTGNINSDPLFADPVNGDLHLTYPSSCKDTGDNTVVSELYDFEGDPRIAYGTVDMGADEFYTHLYWTGDAIPGGDVEVKFVGIPGTSPVNLCIGTGVLDPPIPSMWGNWYLHFPIIGPVCLGSISSPDGVLIIPGAIPGTSPAPYSIPMQALIGAELTNLSILEIE